jgi:hypothetical protein
MRLLQQKLDYIVDTEDSAKELMEKFRANATKEGYTIKKASYERKDKKSKGEIIATVFVVTIVQVFSSLWEDVE